MHDIRNLAVVAHIDSGKTTLTESILLRSSYLTESGSVDAGSTTTDFLPAERERGITIQSASIPVEWKGWHINLIDTPGHADFGMEVESASRVVDGAIVLIDSVEGVEAQTTGVWSQLDRYGVPTRLMFMNKLDRAGSSYHASMLSLLAHRIHPKPMAITLPVASFDSKNYKFAEPGIEGIVDLVKWEVWRWGQDGAPTRHALPVSGQVTDSELFPADHPLNPVLLPARAALLENLSMLSDSLMEQYLDLPSDPAANLAISPATLIHHLRSVTLRGEILPVFCGSAMKHVGTEIVLDYAGELLASPLDVLHEKQTNNSPVQMLVWKVGWDNRKGWMTFVRVYSGTLRTQSILWNPTRNAKERVSKLLLLYASEAVEIDELPFGSVGVILGMRHTRTGDTLLSQGKTHPSKGSALANISPPPAVMASAVIPHSHSDLTPVEEALHALARTDPSVRIETHEGQLLAYGLGALHLEIVEGRLRDEWKVNFEFGKRIVSYREGLGDLDPQGESAMSYYGSAGRSGPGATIHFSLRELHGGEAGDAAWHGNVVIGPDNKPLPGPDAYFDSSDPLGHIARGISAALSNSPHTSLPFSGVLVQVKSFAITPEAPSSILGGAAAFLLRNQLKACGPGPLMEPYIRLDISVTEDAVGRVVKDLNEHRGEVLDLTAPTTGAEDAEPFPQDGVYIPPRWMSPSTVDPRNDANARKQRREVSALAPLSQMLDYPVRLRALSGGHGRFEMAPAGFKVVNNLRKMEILREIGRA
ncbi:P-loop containing nucleoside triphosphate hydrolase protein [Vararia minispora EC-137]|uniref:P-loop containing nucleoside triphosphate hydrolase protein n=1 Tax=Vararia minispora EC-137 TaxID=1314806 RepID=A0ACB8QY22_9AGAM|nr:P-loop containing nucleoside triphosphate hydrolase protein [Vararia minispora EC-137]